MPFRGDRTPRIAAETNLGARSKWLSLWCGSAFLRMVCRVTKLWSKTLTCSPSPRVEASRAYLFRTAGMQCFCTTGSVAGTPFRCLDVPSVFLSGGVTAFHQEQVTMMIFCPLGCHPFTLRGKLWFDIQPPDRVAVDHEQM